MDLVSSIMDYEDGNLTAREELELFSHLVKTGMVWQLQGFYGRTADAMIREGYLYENGDISDFAEETLRELEEEGR